MKLKSRRKKPEQADEKGQKKKKDYRFKQIATKKRNAPSKNSKQKQDDEAEKPEKEKSLMEKESKNVAPGVPQSASQSKIESRMMAIPKQVHRERRKAKEIAVREEIEEEGSENNGEDSVRLAGQDDKLEAIRNMGFGGFLHLDMPRSNSPRNTPEFFAKLVENVEISGLCILCDRNRSMSIEPIHVHLVYGVPIGGKKIVEAKVEDNELNEMVVKFKQYHDGKIPTLTSLSENLEYTLMIREAIERIANEFVNLSNVLKMGERFHNTSLEQENTLFNVSAMWARCSGCKMPGAEFHSSTPMQKVDGGSLLSQDVEFFASDWFGDIIDNVVKSAKFQNTLCQDDAYKDDSQEVTEEKRLANFIETLDYWLIDCEIESVKGVRLFFFPVYVNVNDASLHSYVMVINTKAKSVEIIDNKPLVEGVEFSSKYYDWPEKMFDALKKLRIYYSNEILTSRVNKNRFEVNDNAEVWFDYKF
uniref:Uncharacterized protein n=1 Tax=Chenopodium quinoa TaxID=63459 RepID=A0A803NCL3_CHEQI